MNVAQFLARYLEELNYRVEKQFLPDGRFNVLALVGDTPPRVMLSTHIDTVPPFIASLR